MSDEPDGSDTADQGGVAGESDDIRGGRTAVVTQPQRPTGKRSRKRVVGDAGDSTGADPAVAKNGSGAKTKKAKKTGSWKDPSRNPIAYICKYLTQVVAELRKVIWPNRNQMVTYTSVVLVFLVFMVTLVGLSDLGLGRLVLLVFGSD